MYFGKVIQKIERPSQVTQVLGHTHGELWPRRMWEGIWIWFQNLQLDEKTYCQKLPTDCHAASSVFSPEMDSTCSQLFPGSGFLKIHKKFAEIGAF